MQKQRDENDEEKEYITKKNKTKNKRTLEWISEVSYSLWNILFASGVSPPVIFSERLWCQNEESWVRGGRPSSSSSQYERRQQEKEETLRETRESIKSEIDRTLNENEMVKIEWEQRRRYEEEQEERVMKRRWKKRWERRWKARKDTQNILKMTAKGLTCLPFQWISVSGRRNIPSLCHPFDDKYNNPCYVRCRNRSKRRKHRQEIKREMSHFVTRPQYNKYYRLQFDSDPALHDTVKDMSEQTRGGHKFEYKGWKIILLRARIQAGQ